MNTAMRMTSRVLTSLVAALGLGVSGRLDAAQAVRPNIVIILADDLGYGDLWESVPDLDAS